MKDVGGTGFAGSSPPFRGRERAAVDVDVGPERRSPLRMLMLERKVDFTEDTAMRHTHLMMMFILVTGRSLLIE